MARPQTPPAGAPREDRRDVLLAGAGLALAAAGAPAAAQNTAAVPLVPPRTEFVYEAVVDIAPTVPLGDSPLGERRIVPITGGTATFGLIGTGAAPASIGTVACTSP